MTTRNDGADPADRGRQTVNLASEITHDDIDAAKLVGATSAEVFEAAIHTALDRQGVHSEGRVIKYGEETIESTLPAGRELA